jgi:hypothetical protein
LPNPGDEYRPVIAEAALPNDGFGLGAARFFWGHNMLARRTFVLLLTDKKELNIV